MAEKNIYPADNVDKDGVAYPTVGENIRNGNNSASLDFTTSDDVNKWLFENLKLSERLRLPIFPLTSKAHWENVEFIIENNIINSKKYNVSGGSNYCILDGSKVLHVLNNFIST